jgi:hypothetical protein
MSIESRLFIERNPKTEEYQVKIVVGLFNDKQDALNHASYIAITKNGSKNIIRTLYSNSRK